MGEVRSSLLETRSSRQGTYLSVFGKRCIRIVFIKMSFYVSPMTSNAPVYNLQNGRLTSHTLFIVLKSLLIRLKAKQAISLEGKM